MEFFNEFFQNPVNTVIERPLESFIYFLVYLALYWIIRDQLYSYLQRLHEVLKNSSMIIYETSKSIFQRATKAFGIGVENEKPVDFGSDKTKAKSRYVSAVIFTFILIPINIWMLGSFLDVFPNLRSSVFPNSELLYSLKASHIVAMAIVIVETFLGWGYYVSEKNAHTYFKWFCLIFFGGLWIVETYTWFQLSYMITGIDGITIMNPAEGTVWEGFFDGFLLLTGAALTFFEFLLGYYTAKYREDFGSLHIMAGLARVASYFQSIAYFISAAVIFVLSTIFYVASYMLIALRWVIQLIMILAKFIFEKIGFKKEEFS